MRNILSAKSRSLLLAIMMCVTITGCDNETDGSIVFLDPNAVLNSEAVCGNGIIETSEACDDGNQIDDDACNNTCVLTSCGDGIVNNGEECDDGNADNTDACLNTCLEASCGDGFIETGVEECEPSTYAADCTGFDGGDNNCNDDCNIEFSCFQEYCNNNSVAIPDNDIGGAVLIIDPADDLVIADVNVHLLSIEHTRVSDLLVSLNKGTETQILFQQACNPGINVIADFNDEDNVGLAADNCAINSPAIFGVFQPQETLSTFDGDNATGTWTLTAIDSLAGETGNLTGFCLQIVPEL